MPDRDGTHSSWQTHFEPLRCAVSAQPITLRSTFSGRTAIHLSRYPAPCAKNAR